MKRVSFKTEFVPDIKEGIKQHTSRWKDLHWRVGEVRAAVTSQNGKPAFLTPVADRFAELECVSAEAKFWKDFTEDDAKKCTVTRDWYTKERAPADMDRIYLYGFKVVEVVK